MRSDDDGPEEGSYFDSSTDSDGGFPMGQGEEYLDPNAYCWTYRGKPYATTATTLDRLERERDTMKATALHAVHAHFTLSEQQARWDEYRAFQELCGQYWRTTGENRFVVWEIPDLLCDGKIEKKGLQRIVSVIWRDTKYVIELWLWDPGKPWVHDRLSGLYHDWQVESNEEGDLWKMRSIRESFLFAWDIVQRFHEIVMTPFGRDYQLPSGLTTVPITEADDGDDFFDIDQQDAGAIEFEGEVVYHEAFQAENDETLRGFGRWNHRKQLIESALSCVGITELRPGQWSNAELLLRGRNVMAIMGTGSGKTIISALVALASGKVVVLLTPYTAVSKTHISTFREMGIATVVWFGHVRKAEKDKNLHMLRFSRPTVILTNLEHLVGEHRDERLVNALLELKRREQIVANIFDEIHVVEEHSDFRPCMTLMGEYLKSMEPIAFGGFSATMSSIQIEGFCRLNDIQNNFFVYRGDLNRQNVFIDTLFSDSNKLTDRVDVALEKVRAAIGLDTNGIVFVRTRKNVRQVAELVSRFLFLSGRTPDLDILAKRKRPLMLDPQTPSPEAMGVFEYHGQMDDDVKEENRTEWMRNPIAIMVATPALGQGIDPPMLSWMVRLSIPGSVTQYAQEIGRPGRRGQPAYSLVIYNKWDQGHLGWVMKHRRMEEETVVRGVHNVVVWYEKIEDLEGLNIVRRKLEMLSEVYDFLSNPNMCHRQALMRLLESGVAIRCLGTCDICSRPRDETLQMVDIRVACQDVWLIVNNLCREENRESAAYGRIEKIWRDTDMFGFFQMKGRLGPQHYCEPWSNNHHMLRAVIDHMLRIRMLIKVSGEFQKGRTMPPLYVFYVGYVSPIEEFPIDLPAQMVNNTWK
jgi:superfamily II DNA helicase RecQ